MHAIKETKLEDLLAIVKNANNTDKELISKAFAFAQKAHEGQFRDSGEPYFSHVAETAKILAELNMSPVMIAAGLLHDVIEDTNITPDEIKKEFGEEILFLIEGVTKLGKLKYRGLKRHTESLRKFFVATSQDVRVLIIRLADRLHNMETLKHLSREKQIRKSNEVLEIFAPLAYRLGMRILNKQLEDLAFSFIDPEEYEKTLQILKQRKKRDMKFLEKFDRSLKKSLAMEGILDFKTSFRVKGIYSTYQKLQRKENIEKIYDITALRVITTSVGDCYKALGIIHSIWKPLPGRLKDYIALPKPNGYQSIHTTIFTGDGGIVEIQIRTKQMHEIAEMGIASHFSYKGNGNIDQKDWIRKLLFKFETLQKNSEGTQAIQDDFVGNTPSWIKNLGDECVEKKDERLLEDLKTDFFEHRVFVFTPNGDVIDLPVDSSPIDFAYAIHSDIGDHVSGSKINGKMASLETKLKNGDIVEIIKKQSSSPTRKWLGIIKTTEARRHIQAKLRENRKS